MIGLSVLRGRIEVCRLSPSGIVLERIRGGGDFPLTRVASEAPSLLAASIDERKIGITVTVTGFVDPDEQTLLLNTAAAARPETLLINGRPNHGCATVANDLGHVRFFTETDRCFCGQTRCLERIVSSEQLARFDGSPTSATVGPRPIVHDV